MLGKDLFVCNFYECCWLCKVVFLGKMLCGYFVWVIGLWWVDVLIWVNVLLVSFDEMFKLVKVNLLVVWID